MSVKRHVTKLIMAVLLTLTALALLVGGTYAWFVLSTHPDVDGMRITLGTPNTIRIAPDQEKNGVHYPGTFSNKLGLSVEGLGALSPVSTADGIHWYLPEYKDLEDGGGLKGSFIEDTTLQYANLPQGQTESGAYAYLDFWVVSPENCRLRVSTSVKVKTTGSYVIALPKAELTGEQISFTKPEAGAETYLRVGFLTDPRPSDVETKALYLAQEGASDQYTAFHGLYDGTWGEEDGQEAPRFAIYEPNADSHRDESLNGQILLTEAVADSGGTTKSLKDRLMIQLAPDWNDMTTLLAGKLAGHQELENAEQAEEFLRSGKLQDWVSEYLWRGLFVARTDALFQQAGDGDAVSVQWLEEQKLTAGAPQDPDVYVAGLSANVPQRIRMFVWLEGQDADCGYDGQSRELLVHLELAGETMRVPNN